MTILYEDNHLLIVNKAVGEIVQGDKTGDTPLSEQLKLYLKEKYHKAGEVFLGVPHRLDRPTSGVVVFTKTSKALERMNALFRTHIVTTLSHASENTAPTDGVQKTYWAIVKHRPPREADRLEHYLWRNEQQNKSYVCEPTRKDAKRAVLSYRVIGQSERYYLLEIQLETGRHHQIRCQLAHIGCPIKGDLKYGFDRSNPDGGISLHARQISFVHPVRREPLTVIAPPPASDLFRLFQGVEA